MGPPGFDRHGAPLGRPRHHHSLDWIHDDRRHRRRRRHAADLVTAVFEGHTTPLSVSRPITYSGHKVVVVKDTVTSGGKKSTARMYIAAKDPAYVYKIVNDTPDEVSSVVFSHYAKGVALTVPPNAINLS